MRRFHRSDSGGENVAKPKRPIGSAAHYAVLGDLHGTSVMCSKIHGSIFEHHFEHNTIFSPSMITE